MSSYELWLNFDCYFIELLFFSSSNIWNDLSQLDRTLIALMRPPYGINNYVNICNGFANFYSCLGPQNIRYCLGLIGLVGMGKSPQDAYSYEGFLADWRFKCGAGFFGSFFSITDLTLTTPTILAVYENITLTSCTQNTYVNYNDEIAATINQYKKNVTTDTDNACKFCKVCSKSHGFLWALSIVTVRAEVQQRVTLNGMVVSQPVNIPMRSSSTASIQPLANVRPTNYCRALRHLQSKAVQPLSVFEEESHQHNQQQQRLYSFS
ncbi:hypothetical protein COOONC_02799 [Cooperia oncophora]